MSIPKQLLFHANYCCASSTTTTAAVEIMPDGTGSLVGQEHARLARSATRNRKACVSLRDSSISQSGAKLWV